VTRLTHTYIDQQFDEPTTPHGRRRVVLLVLKSPRFLYREVGGGSDGYDTAARLSFGLWDSIPDRELLAAARSGELATDDQVRQQAERMIADLRARTKLRDFLLTWLNVDGEVDLSKDPEKFPNFDAAAIADLRASLELFFDDVVWSDASDYRELLLSDKLYLNERLAKLYLRGLPLALSASRPTSKSKLDDGQRAGVLTHRHHGPSPPQRNLAHPSRAFSPAASWASRSAHRPKPSRRSRPSCIPT
jgi:hypothetical protein